MDEFIARANIDHYRKLLADESDPASRQRLLDLLAEEEKKLEAASNRKAEGRGYVNIRIAWIGRLISLSPENDSKQAKRPKAMPALPSGNAAGQARRSDRSSLRPMQRNDRACPTQWDEKKPGQM